jgi:hypothetical protein
MHCKLLKFANKKLWFNAGRDIIMQESSNPLIPQGNTAAVPLLDGKSNKYVFSFPLYPSVEAISPSIGVHEVKALLFYDVNAPDKSKPYLRTVDHLVYLYKEKVTLKFSTFAYVADPVPFYPPNFKFSTSASINDASNTFTGSSVNVVLRRPTAAPLLVIKIKDIVSPIVSSFIEY